MRVVFFLRRNKIFACLRTKWIDVARWTCLVVMAIENARNFLSDMAFNKVLIESCVQQISIYTNKFNIQKNYNKYLVCKICSWLTSQFHTKIRTLIIHHSANAKVSGLFWFSITTYLLYIWILHTTKYPLYCFFQFLLLIASQQWQQKQIIDFYCDFESNADWKVHIFKQTKMFLYLLIQYANTHFSVIIRSHLGISIENNRFFFEFSNRRTNDDLFFRTLFNKLIYMQMQYFFYSCL